MISMVWFATVSVNTTPGIGISHCNGTRSKRTLDPVDVGVGNHLIDVRQHSDTTVQNLHEIDDGSELSIERQIGVCRGQSGISRSSHTSQVPHATIIYRLAYALWHG